MGLVSKKRLEELSTIKSKLMVSITKEIEEGNITAVELLAILSYAVGQCVALLDKEKFTKDRAMDVVANNIEIGNQAVVNDLDGMSGLLH